MCRSPCCSIEGLNRGSWTKKEDIILSEYIRVHGDGGWTNLPQRAGLRRCGKSCRLRWLNYLRPDIKRGNISPYEEDLIVRLHRLLGNRWSLIAGRLPGRTDNEIKNYWNTRLSKKLLSMNKTQPKSSEENLKRTSKYSSCSQNYLYEPIPVKTTTAVRQSELLRPNGCSDIHSSDKAFHFSNIRETMNSSKSRCDLLVNDSVTEDDSEPMSFGIADVNLVETEGTNSACSMSNSAYQQLLHSDYFPGHAGTFDESLFDLSKLSSPLCNVLSSQSYFSTDSGSEDFYSGLATLDAEMNVYEYMCSSQSNVQYVNNFALPDDQELKNSTTAQIP